MKLEGIPGWQFLQIPGPTNVPDRVLRAMDHPTIDHRGPRFQELARHVLAGLAEVIKTKGPVVIYPASGTGAWEAALVNTLSPGDQVLMYETGHFAAQWQELAGRLGLDPLLIEGDWRGGADPDRIAEHLVADREHRIKAVCIVHNETSTGCVSPILRIRKAIDQVSHPALFMVDTISSLASMAYDHDGWGVDVTVGASQKGLMLPPGLSFNAISPKALGKGKAATLPRSYWEWDRMIGASGEGLFPYTPATNLLYGLQEALVMLREQGLEQVIARHQRHGEATRRAVRAWGLEVLCADPAAYSGSITAVMTPDGVDADHFREVTLRACHLSLGNGLARLSKRVFRIGHLGAFNDLMLVAALAGVEMGLRRASVPFRPGGVQAAMDYLGSD